MSRQLQKSKATPNTLLNQFLEILKEIGQKELIEPAMMNRGRQWLEEAEKEFPIYINALRLLAKASPETVINVIVRENPNLAFLRNNKAAHEFIRMIQRGTKQGTVK